MRIALVVPSLHGGGAEFVASQWAQYLRQSGDDVTVFATHPNDNDSCERIAGSGFVTRLKDLRKTLKAGQYDAVLSFAPHWNLLAILSSMWLSPKPRVVISGRTMEAESLRMGKVKKAEIALARVLYRYADGFVAISHPTAAEAQAMFRVSNSKIWVVPNPATAKLTKREASRSRSTGFPTSPRQIHIVVPGRLVPGKRPHLAVKVAEECARMSGRDVVLHFFGTGVESASLSDVNREHVRLVYHGWVEHWFDEAPDQSIVLLPSRIEGFANVLVEAAGAGFPSVASSRALGVADAMIPGVTGVLSLTDSVAHFSRAVLEAEKLPAHRADGWLYRFSPVASGSMVRESLKGEEEWVVARSVKSLKAE